MAERIRVQVADGTWETLGVDRNPGLYPEGINPTWNAGGSDGLTFSLRRPADAVVDLEEFTPLEYLPDGRDAPTWSGFVLETPASGDPDDPAVSVNARGWQYHGEDDVYKRLFVHERLADWTDLRERTDTDVSHVGTAAAQTQLGNNGVVLGWPKGAQVGGSLPWSAVLFDCGTDTEYWPQAVAVDLVKNTLVAAGGVELQARSTDNPNLYGGSFETVVLAASSLANGTYNNVVATFVTRRRYLVLVAFYTGAGGTFGEDDLYTITGARMARLSSYLAGGQSVLKASDVIANVYAARAPLLSADQSLIAATTTPIRHFTADDETPGALADRANSYHAYRLKIDAARRVVFQPAPARATITVDLAQPGAAFRDASTNSGAAIYNRVLVRGKSGAGVDLRVTRVTTDALGAGRTATPDRRGFTRTFILDVAAPTDAVGMAALGDAFLRLHAYTQLAGDLVITSDQAVRRIGSEEPIPLGDLGTFTGEFILLENLIDPDTGDLGRVGIIKSVSKTGESATVTLDNERANFQSLLDRMGALSA